MIYTKHQTNKSFVLILLLVLNIGFAYQVLAAQDTNQTVKNIAEEEMPAILKLIADSVHQNYERIETWSGDIDEKITWLDTGTSAENLFKNATDAKGEAPEAIMQKAEEKITFAVDAKKNLVYVDKVREKNQYLNPITGANLGRRSSQNIQSGFVASPDYIIVAEPYSFEKSTDRIIQNKAVKKISKLNGRTGLYVGIDDPRKVFMPGEISVWDYHNILIDKIKRFGMIEFDGYKFKMEEHKKGDYIEYVITEPGIVNMERNSPDDYTLITKVFSGQYGFNMIIWQVTSGDGNSLEAFTCEYESINDVYLPKRVTEKYYGADGRVAKEKDCTYINNKANPAISPGTFEPTNLKLKDGDVLVDEISKEEYKYEAATKTFKLSEKQKK